MPLLQGPDDRDMRRLDDLEVMGRFASKGLQSPLYKCIRSVGAVSMRLGRYAFRET